MDRKQILIQLNIIFQNVLDSNKLLIVEETKSADVDEWDSLMHLILIDTIEKHFKVHFTTHEIQEWQKINDIINLIVSKDMTDLK